MSSPSLEVCVSIIVLEGIISLFTSGFIILSLTLSHPKGTHIAPYNYILIALNISNICFVTVLFVSLLLTFFWPSFFNAASLSGIITYLTFCSIISSCWLTADLCFFYFIKILQVQSRFLAWMKIKINKMVPWLIFIVEIVSLMEGFVALYIFGQGISMNSTIAASDKISVQHQLRLKFMNIILMMTILPFMISMLTTAASAMSLKLHNDSIKSSMGHTNVRDYQSAVQTMACLIVFYALMYLFMILYGQELFAEQSWGYWMCLLILSSFSMVHSILLINGNPKLRESWKKIFKII